MEINGNQNCLVKNKQKKKNFYVSQKKENYTDLERHEGR